MEKYLPQFSSLHIKFNFKTCVYTQVVILQYGDRRILVGIRLLHFGKNIAS